jgi:molecular chaperone Hsp33
MRTIHNSTATATAAAGRLLTAAMMMGMMMKNEKDRLTLIVNGNGPIEQITVTGNSRAQAKCDIRYPNIDVFVNEYGKLDVGRAVGAGTLTVIRDIGLKLPYNSTIELVSSEIAEDIAYYYAASEQIPTVCSLGVLVQPDNSVLCAGGFIIQVMPTCPEKVVDYLENIIKELPSITTMLKNNMTEIDIINEIFKKGGYDYKIEENISPEYYCDCSYEKIEGILKSLGREELENILKEQQEIKLKCHFCNKKYDFDIGRILKSLKID